MASAAANAAFELASVLESASSLGASDAQDVAASLSLIMDVKVASDMWSTNTSATSAAAEGITAAVNQLARAAAAGAEAGFDTAGNVSAATELLVTSKNFNMSIDVRSDPAELARTPFACDSVAGEPALVALPAVAVEDAEGFNSSLPVTAVLFTTPVNLHPAPQARRRTLSASASETTSPSTVNSTVSPTVSFSLTQQTRVLKVRNASSNINVSLPFVPSPSACLGQPIDAKSAAACTTTVECRWWDELDQRWSTEGCTTVLAARTVACVCDHLTEFVAFEFPTSVEELIATLLDAISMQTLSERALQCALEPRRTWRTVPVLYWCTFALLSLFILLLTNAVVKDRAEVRMTAALLRGKKKSAGSAQLPHLDSTVRLKTMARIQTGSMARLKTMGRIRIGSMARLKTMGRIQTGTPALSASPPPSPPLSSAATISNAVALDGAGSGSSDNQADRPRILGSILSDSPVLTFSDTSCLPDEVSTMHDVAVVDISDAISDNSTLAQLAATVKAPKDFNSTTLDVESIGSEPTTNACAPAGISTKLDEDEKLATQAAHDYRKVTVSSSSLVRGRWKKGLHGTQANIVASRWNKDVDRVWKRVCLACMSSHSLCSGICYRGAGNFTRAQTVMVLVNSFAFELVLLCIFYEEDEPREDGEALITINLIAIGVGATYCALIVIPVMLIFVWLFEPMIFVRLGRWAFRTMFCWPCFLRQRFCLQEAPCSIRHRRMKVHPNPRHHRKAKAPEVKSTERIQTTPFAPADDTKTPSAVAHSPNDHGVSPERQFAYTSLHDVMLKASLTHSWKRRDWPSIRKILFGWVGNFICFGLMIFLFSLYMCELFEPPPFGVSSDSNTTNATETGLEEEQDEPAGDTDELLIAWALSCFQRFVRTQHIAHHIAQPSCHTQQLHFGRCAHGRSWPSLPLSYDSLRAIVSEVCRCMQAAHPTLSCHTLVPSPWQILHEPIMILASKGLPILFASAFCANCCGETIVALIELVVMGIVACIKEIRGS